MSNLRLGSKLIFKMLFAVGTLKNLLLLVLVFTWEEISCVSKIFYHNLPFPYTRRDQLTLETHTRMVSVLQSTLHISMFYISISLPMSMISKVPSVCIHFHSPYFDILLISISPYLDVFLLSVCSQFSLRMSILPISKVTRPKFWDSKQIGSAK